MAYFEDGVRLTPQGKALNARILANNVQFSLSAIAVGSGIAQADPNGLANELFRTSDIRIRIINDVTVVFVVNFSDFAQQSSTAWQFREIGIFANDPDTENEILYAYANAGENFDTIPPDGASTYLQRELRLPVEVANAANIYINITETRDVSVENLNTAGAAVFAFQDIDTDNYMLRRILAGDGIEVSQRTQDILISANTTAENLGTAGGGIGIFHERETRDSNHVLTFRRIAGGEGIEIDEIEGAISVSQKTLRQDLDLYVSLDADDAAPNFTSIQNALDYLQDFFIPTNRHARIHVESGRYQLSDAIRIGHPQARQIQIIGPDNPLVQFNGCSAPSGGWGNYSVTLNNVSDTGNITVGDFIMINQSGWSPLAWLLRGFFRVTAIAAGQVTITIPYPFGSMGALNVGAGSFHPVTAIMESAQNVSGLSIGNNGLGSISNIGFVSAAAYTGGPQVQGMVITGPVSLNRVGMWGWIGPNVNGFWLSGGNADVHMAHCAAVCCSNGLSIGSNAALRISGEVYMSHNLNSHGMSINDGGYVGVSGTLIASGNSVYGIAIIGGNLSFIISASAMSFNGSYGMFLTDGGIARVGNATLNVSNSQGPADIYARFGAMFTGANNPGQPGFQFGLIGDRRFDPAFNVMGNMGAFIV